MDRWEAPFPLPFHPPPSIPPELLYELDPHLELRTSFSPAELGRFPPAPQRPAWHCHYGFCGGLALRGDSHFPIVLITLPRVFSWQTQLTKTFSAQRRKAMPSDPEGSP